MRTALTSRSLLRRPRLLLASGFLVAGALLAFGSLPLTARWYNVQSLGDAVRHPPALRAAVPMEAYEVGLAGATRLTQHAAPAAYRLSSVIGHDDLGRSLLFRLLPGFAVSLLIGLAAAGIAVVIGVLWGATAGLLGGAADTAMMRLVDLLFSLPYLLTVILLKVGLDAPLRWAVGGRGQAVNLVVLLLAIGGAAWPTLARVVRGQVLSLRARPFVEAARAAGASRGRVLMRHLLPNLVGPVVVYGSLIVPQAILQESFLSFLGIGVQQPTPSLGRLAADGVQAVNTFVGYWWLLAFPCGLLALTLLALNVLGDGLRDALDPQSGEQ